MITRNNQKLVWQYFDKFNFIKYIDSLKVRIYKGFLSRYLPEVYKRQFIFTTSPLVIIYALKKSIINSKVNLSSFEFGYIILCLSRGIVLDLSAFNYYNASFSKNKISRIKYLIQKAQHLILIWCLEPYYNYLICLNESFNKQFYNLNKYNQKLNYELIGKYYIFFDLRLYFHHLSLSILLNKLYLNSVIKVYLLKFLQMEKFLNLSLHLDISSIYIPFPNICLNLTFKILEIFILQICYELFIMLSNFSLHRKINYKVLCISEKFTLIFFCDNIIKILRKNFLNFLLFQGIKIKKYKEKLPISLFDSCDFNLLLLLNNYQIYPFYLVIKPSLYSQFFLIKQFSVILFQSASKPLFLLCIRLNMLLFSWSNNYLRQNSKKIFYMIDYLLNLKLRLFMKKTIYKGSFCKVDIYYRANIINNSKYVLFNSICTRINNRKYFIYYLIIKLFWLYQLKFNINLREAI